MAEQTQTVEFDPETATYDELRAKAEEEFKANQGQDNSQGQELPRDEQGRFTKTGKNEPTVNEEGENQTVEVDEIVYRKVIDLGDGSGVQVFEAPTAEDLIEKLAKAQENATRKIQELTRKKVEVEQPTTRTPEEEWLRSQELLATPSKTVEKIFEEVTGMPVKAFKTKLDRLNAFEQAQSEEAAAREFIAKTPDFYPCPANAKKIEKYVKTYGLDGTKAESIEQAYLDLSESGLLETRPAETQEDVQETRQPSRIATPEPRPQAKTRMSSGISARRSVAQRGASEPTEDDLYSMPLDKLRELAVKTGDTQN